MKRFSTVRIVLCRAVHLDLGKPTHILSLLVEELAFFQAMDGFHVLWQVCAAAGCGHAGCRRELWGSLPRTPAVVGLPNENAQGNAIRAGRSVSAGRAEKVEPAEESGLCAGLLRIDSRQASLKTIKEGNRQSTC